MRPIYAATALSLASATLAFPALAAEDEPWKKPGWEPISEEERQPVTPDEIAASAVAVQEYRGVRYLTGGLGAGERAWLEQHGTSFPVTLQFSKGQRGAFVSSVDVTIRDESGQTRFEATTDGPLIYIDLPAGDYQATTRYRGHARDFELRVPATGRTTQSINFP
ncbi:MULTISPECIES: hypothetical protein [unclassified Guyparkeria]|uniref:hypothetical protein n=1 Tax=unclassified Guyparkeria TaxID=2626246 RepID=UPI00073378D8|nr:MULTISPECIES: hypothetical protein [unclassified Guyparkeria]KTG17623.1 hypothetical protein AUR63_08225 [Guyparkeria sp. XI15]OAE88436.1 hypothetical protein AWR35_08240 [Guyparkeria sp. WRN-7]